MRKKNIIRGLYSLIKEYFSKCFICNMGSESGSLHSTCKEKQHLSLSSSTEPLTPQKEGQRETLFSICTPSWSQGCAFGWKEALVVCLLHPLACLSSCPLALNCLCLLLLRIQATARSKWRVCALGIGPICFRSLS